MTIPLKVQHHCFSGCFRCLLFSAVYNVSRYGFIWVNPITSKIHSTPWICRFMSFTKFRKFSALFFSALHFSPLLLGLWWHNVTPFFLNLFHKFCSFFGDLFLNSDGIGLGILISSFTISIGLLFVSFISLLILFILHLFPECLCLLVQAFYNSCFEDFVS